MDDRTRSPLLPPPFPADEPIDPRSGRPFAARPPAAHTTELGEEPPAAGLALVVEPAAGPPLRVPLGDEASIVVGGAWAELDEEDRLAIPDPTVSARHARIEVRCGRARIVDLGSRNGTWVGGARVEAAALSIGACAIVGRSTITVEETFTEAEHESDEPIPGAIGRSAPMRRLASIVRTYAALHAPVLVRGESGSGKEVVARALHALSSRADGPFQAVNLGALPRELAEAELFGHERGAFTGAAGARQGLFELADGGTLFLDELGELPLDIQAKLLRVLETGEVRRLGARAAKRVDVRIVAATWAPLERRILDGSFREDLFHRVAVLVVDVPPLRDRKGDIPAIAAALLAMSRDFANKSLTPAANSRLIAESWPGNVRELKNVIYRAAANARGDVIDAVDVTRALGGRGSQPPPKTTRDPRTALALVKTHGTIAAAARAAGIPRETLRDWVRSTGSRRPGAA